MSTDRWRRIERLYHAALERPGDERAAFLAEACQDEKRGVPGDCRPGAVEMRICPCFGPSHRVQETAAQSK